MQPLSSLVLALILVLVACSVKQSSELKAEPRIHDNNSKYANKENDVGLGDFMPTMASNTLYEDFESESRIVLSEPYRSLVATGARFVVAQSSLPQYMSIETFMDVASDACYALSKPSTLIKALKTVAILAISFLAVAFLLPASLTRNLSSALSSREPLMKLEKYMHKGFNESGIIKLLNERAEALLARYHLNDSSCREQAVCHAGEFVRCTFPKHSKSAIHFVSENFSRSKYTSNRYLSAFLTGFIDQNCVISVEPSDSSHPKSCVGDFVRALSLCSGSLQKSPEQSFTSSPFNSTSTPDKPKTLSYRSIPVSRAK